jgi:hypothetical protein
MHFHHFQLPQTLKFGESKSKTIESSKKNHTNPEISAYRNDIQSQGIQKTHAKDTKIQQGKSTNKPPNSSRAKPNLNEELRSQ